MITHKFKLRVTYADTDKMGTMHHSNYVKYYEIARWELLRNFGVPYGAVEEAGIMCPVVKMHFSFLKTTFYDELLTIHTHLKAIRGARMWFEYKMYNQNNELINTAETEIAFVKSNNWKPCKAPEFLLKAISEHSQMTQK